MFKSKPKIQLSENLKLAVSGPASQGTVFKVAGAVFLILSLILAGNLFKNLYSAKQAATIASQPQATDAKVLGAYDDASTKQPQINTYTVQPGDTLFNIGQHQGASWELIATLNNLKPPYKLKTGSTLKIPSPN